MRLVHRIDRFNFLGLNISHLFICPKFIGFHNFLLAKTIRYELTDSQNIHGFALIYVQSSSFSTLKNATVQFVSKTLHNFKHQLRAIYTVMG